MDWKGVVSSAVSSCASLVSGLTGSANDQKKAVKAAKKAGKQAKKNAEKLYPNWDFGGRKLAKSEGIKNRGEWKRARAKAGQEAYDEAYHEVWDMYVEAKEAEINNLQHQTSQEALDHELQMAQINAESMAAALALEAQSNQTDTVNVKSGGIGCVGFALALSGGLVYSVYEFVKYVSYLI